MRDRGSMTVFVVLVGAAVSLAVLTALVPLLDGLIDRQHAQAAADAAALAGVEGGRSAAVSIAAANGAVLVSWRTRGDEVTVVVQIDGQRASARATDAP